MAISDFFFYANCAYLIILLVSFAVAIRLWMLNDAHESGAANRPERRKTQQVALILAGLGAMASVGLFILSRSIAKEADRSILSASAAADIAKASAVEALARAEGEKVERLKLEKAFAWRRIPADDSKNATEVLSKNPKRVKFIVVDHDPETVFYAYQISKIFRDAKWETNVVIAAFSGTIFTGNIIKESDSEATTLVMAAFEAIKQRAGKGEIPQSYMTFGDANFSADATVLLTPKPPPAEVMMNFSDKN